MHHLLTKDTIAAIREAITQHQFNDNAIRHSKNLSTPTGMQRIGIHLVRVESGHDSTTHHYHDADEEFIFVLAGRGIAKIGDSEHPIAAGDFMGFPAPSPPHSMHNPYSEDLIYLVGGERWPVDIVHYPDIARSMIKHHGARQWAEDDAFTDLPPRS